MLFGDDSSGMDINLHWQNVFYTVMLWKGSQVPQQEDAEEAVTKKAIKELEIFVSQVFYNFFLVISPFFSITSLCHFFSILFLPTTFTHTHTHDPRPLPTTHDPWHLATLVVLYQPLINVQAQPASFWWYLSKVVNIINNVSYMYVDYYLPVTSVTLYPFEAEDW